MRWLEKQGLLEEAAGALQRATITTCRTRPDMHLFAMHYDERHGNIDGARARYKQVLGELAPRLLSATVAAANFERRQVRRGPRPTDSLRLNGICRGSYWVVAVAMPHNACRSSHPLNSSEHLH